MEELHRKFYISQDSSTIVGVICGGDGAFSCDGERMERLTASSGGAETPHPSVTVVGREVSVRIEREKASPEGETVSCPADWVYLRTSQGGHRKNRMENDGEDRPFSFLLCDGEKPLEVYAYSPRYGLCSCLL